MYESQQWLSLASLFRLVGCPIPRELKAEVLLTLACFAKSPDIAATMTHTLESVQVRRGGRGAAGNGRQSGGQLGTCTCTYACTCILYMYLYIHTMYMH